jgi:hypothetical protein
VVRAETAAKGRQEPGGLNRHQSPRSGHSNGRTRNCPPPQDMATLYHGEPVCQTRSPGFRGRARPDRGSGGLDRGAGTFAGIFFTGILAVLLGSLMSPQ